MVERLVERLVSPLRIGLGDGLQEPARKEGGTVGRVLGPLGDHEAREHGRAGASDARHGGPAPGEHGRAGGRDLLVHRVDEQPDFVVSMSEDCPENLGRTCSITANGKTEDAVVVARTADFDRPVCKGPFERQSEYPRIELIATDRVHDAGELQGTTHEDPAFHTRDEDVLTGDDVPNRVDQPRREPGARFE
jgi:hypothetical protein